MLPGRRSRGAVNPRSIFRMGTMRWVPPGSPIPIAHILRIDRWAYESSRSAVIRGRMDLSQVRLCVPIHLQTGTPGNRRHSVFSGLLVSIRVYPPVAPGNTHGIWKLGPRGGTKLRNAVKLKHVNPLMQKVIYTIVGIVEFGS